MYRFMLPLLLVGLLAVPDVRAQPADGAGGPKTKKKGRRKPQDPLIIFRQLSERLKLDEDQKVQIQPLVEEYTQAVRQIMDAVPQDVRENRRAIQQEMREAKRAKDRDKVKELSEKLKDMRKNDPRPAAMTKITGEYVPKIEALLREDQKLAFRKMLSQKGPSLSNPKFLRACVGRLDLREDQKTELKKIDREFREAMKGLGKGTPPGKRKKMVDQYREEILKLLDPAQKQQLEEIAKKGQAQRGRKGGLRNPRMLDRALETINLRPDQQTNIDALKERFMTDARAVGRDRKARGELGRKFLKDVMAQLDDAQKEELAKFQPPKRKQGGKRGKRAGAENP